MMEVSITRLNSEGEGVGKLLDGKTVFIPGALPGETVTVAITEDKKTFARARLIGIIEESPDRVPSSCQGQASCGGCSLAHLSYSGQLDYKRRKIVDALERIGGFKGCGDMVLPVKQSRKQWEYRNKLQLLASGKSGTIGFCTPGTNDVQPFNGCRLSEPLVQTAAKVAVDAIMGSGLPLKEWPSADIQDQERAGGLRHLIVRALGNEATVTLVTDSPIPENAIAVRQRLFSIADAIIAVEPRVTSVAWNQNDNHTSELPMGPTMEVLRGSGRLTLKLPGFTFSVSPTAFVQVNTGQTRALYDTVLKYMNPGSGDNLLDLYSGTGTIALTLGAKAHRVVGIEVVPSAVEDAKRNARMSKATNVIFHAGTVEAVMPGLLAEGFKPVGAVLDPSRKGCEPGVLKALAGSGVQRIVYVACDPASLARDASRLRELGYVLKEVQPVDMFPQTYHVECVAKMERP